MDREYVYKTIKFILEQRVNLVPSGVPYKVLVDAIQDDLKMAINELVGEGLISFKKDINKQPIFYDNA